MILSCSNHKDAIVIFEGVAPMGCPVCDKYGKLEIEFEDLEKELNAVRESLIKIDRKGG